MDQPMVVFPAQAQQYVQALVRDADQLVEDIENLLARRNSLWGSLSVLTGWHADDATERECQAGEASFQALLEQSRLSDVDLLFELAAGRLVAARKSWKPPVKPVSTKRAYRRRRAIRGPLVDLEADR